MMYSTRAIAHEHGYRSSSNRAVGSDDASSGMSPPHHPPHQYYYHSRHEDEAPVTRRRRQDGHSTSKDKKSKGPMSSIYRSLPRTFRNMVKMTVLLVLAAAAFHLGASGVNYRDGATFDVDAYLRSTNVDNMEMVQRRITDDETAAGGEATAMNGKREARLGSDKKPYLLNGHLPAAPKASKFAAGKYTGIATGEEADEQTENHKAPTSVQEEGSEPLHLKQNEGRASDVAVSDEYKKADTDSKEEQGTANPVPAVEKDKAPLSSDADPPPADDSSPNLSNEKLGNYKDSWDLYETSDTPVFWHIPKAGGSTVKDIIGSCHRFVMATEFGVTDGHDQDTKIAVVYPATPGAPPGQDRSPFVNVDTTTVAGIERAKQMGFADSGLADAVVSPFIYEANDLFAPTAKGRLFTVFRHPIDRAISLFYYIQVANWEPTYSPELKDWSLEQYATSGIIENNWMTRQLSNQLSGELSEDDLKVAMDVVRRKFLVGLMTKIGETMERFEKFFRWKYHVNPTTQEACRDRLLSGGSNSNKSNKKEKPKEGSREWELLAWQNQYDLQLYEYIEQLFVEQEEFVANAPDGFRKIDATCCKCNPPTFPPEGFTCPKAVK